MFIKINEYKEGTTNFNALRLEVTHYKSHKVMVSSITPVQIHDYGYSTVIDFSRNPLTAGLTLSRVPMPRKSQKRIDAAQAELNAHASQIAELWNNRDFETIKNLLS